MNYKVVTVCNRIPTENYYCIYEFAKSVQDAPMLVLTNELMGEYYNGLGTKPKWLYKAIEKGMIDEEYIIFCDSWDLVFAQHPKTLLANYLNWFPDKPIVISSEKNCFPDTLKKEYDEVAEKNFIKHGYKYLNSGMIVGKTEDIFKLLTAMDVLNIPDDYRKEDGNMCHINDQELYQQIFLKQPIPIQLDYNQQLCNTLHSVTLEELAFEPQGILNKETGRVPCSLHFNGDAKTKGLREPILKHLKLI